MLSWKGLTETPESISQPCPGQPQHHPLCQSLVQTHPEPCQAVLCPLPSGAAPGPRHPLGAEASDTQPEPPQLHPL